MAGKHLPLPCRGAPHLCKLLHWGAVEPICCSFAGLRQTGGTASGNHKVRKKFFPTVLPTIHGFILFTNRLRTRDLATPLTESALPSANGNMRVRCSIPHLLLVASLVLAQQLVRQVF